VYLQTHPLAQAVLRDGSDGTTTHTGQALRRLLLDAIERLTPAADATARPHGLRGHRILTLRYAEGLDVPAVLRRLSIGKSLYYVEHERALAAVASLLSERGRPAPLTPLARPPAGFVGRERELARVRQLLRAGRLLTLTGPPGTGKTRLAMEVAAELSAAFADGVCVVPLAHLRHPDLVVPAVARALGAPDGWGRSAVDRLAAVAGTKQVLLLLDNFEHVLDAAPRLVEILERCPGLTVLATSRARLGLRGEQELVVPPLAVPEPDRPLTAAEAARYPAVALFAQRVRELQADFVLTDEDAPAVVGICRRLDGLPLAIELAAPRLKTLPPAALLARLGPAQRALPLLTVGPRDLPQRQQTMRGAIDWSYGLLGPREQGLLRRLAVFVGGCTLAAAQHAWGSDPLDALGALIDNSLVQREVGVDGEPRFVPLETIREYARERLVASGELEATQSRHAEYVLRLAEEAEPHLAGQGQVAWTHRLDAEHGNLRAALAWLVERGETARGLRLAAAVHYFWYIRGYAGEGRAWLAQLLGQPSAAARTPLRAKALEADGLLATWQGEYPVARARLEESLAVAREVGDGAREGGVLFHLAQVLHAQGDDAAAKGFAEESLAIGERGEHFIVICRALTLLGTIALVEGDYVGARDRLERSLRLRHDVGLVVGAGSTLRMVGVGATLWLLGVVATRLGDYGRARPLLSEALVIARDAGQPQGILSALEASAGLAVAEGQPARGARLLAAAAAGREAIGMMPLWARSNRDHTTAACRVALSEDAYEAAWAEGRAMTVPEAIADALDNG
jgi:predicted ATPase